MAETAFGPLLAPRSLALAGVSSRRRSLGTALLEHLRSFGYGGDLHVVHPTAGQVAGVPAVPSLDDLPGPVDCTIVTLPASQVPGFVRANGHRTRFVHVLSGGFAEAGNLALEAELLEAAHATGTRLVGPNCLGTYAPAAGLTFVDGAPPEAGSIALVSQSGGLATDVIRHGGVRGLRFSGVVTVGNCTDVTVEELAEHFAEDASTRLLALYLEHVADGERFLRALARLVPERPVVVLRGGLTATGQRSASSHTGSMATPGRLWEGLCSQAGVVGVASVEELVDTLVAFQGRQATLGRDLVLFGTGGGASVTAADEAERAGFRLPPLDGTVRSALAELGVGAGSSLANPVDTPAGALAGDGGAVAGRVLDVLAASGADVVLTHLNLHPFVAFTQDGDRLVEGIVRAVVGRRGTPTTPLVLRSTGELVVEQLKDRARRLAVDAGTPVFDSIGGALRAYAHVASFGRCWTARARYTEPNRGT